MNLKQKLTWFIQMGISETIAETPNNRFVEKITPVVEPITNTTLVSAAQTTAESANRLEDLITLIDQFDGCPLKKTATHTIHGRGVQKPIIMCVDEAPSADDDKSGTAFSGEAGELFKKMLGAIGLDIETNVYATYLMPWRPPGNRKLTATEIATTLPFLKKEIELIQPHLLLIFNASVVQALLGIDSLAKARGAWHSYRAGHIDIPVRATFSPQTLLKMQNQKKQAWADLQAVQEKLPAQV